MRPIEEMGRVLMNVPGRGICHVRAHKPHRIFQKVLHSVDELCLCVYVCGKKDVLFFCHLNYDESYILQCDPPASIASNL